MPLLASPSEFCPNNFLCYFIKEGHFHATVGIVTSHCILVPGTSSSIIRSVGKVQAGARCPTEGGRKSTVTQAWLGSGPKRGPLPHRGAVYSRGHGRRDEEATGGLRLKPWALVSPSQPVFPEVFLGPSAGPCLTPPGPSGCVALGKQGEPPAASVYIP